MNTRMYWPYPHALYRFDEDGNSTVNVLGANSKEESRVVKTGLRSFDGRIEILEGLTEGDNVILSTR